MGLAHAATLDVCATCAYTGIDAALSDAEDGDEIVVQPGTYTGSLVIDADLTVRSTDGAAVTVIEPSGVAPAAVRVENATVTLEGFTVGVDAQRAIEAANANLTIRDALVDGGTSSNQGVGVRATGGGTLVVESSVFRNLTTTSDGGCISVIQGVDTTLNAVTCESVSARDGGAVDVRSGADLTITASIFSQTTSTIRGGAVHVDNASDVEIVDTTITGAVSGEDGGGLHIRNASSLRVTDTVFSQNDSSRDGGAVYTHDNVSSTTFERVEFLSNTAGRDGGAFHVGSPADVRFSRFELNSASEEGGAAHLDAVATIEYTVFEQNSAGLGGALYLGASAAGTDLQFLDNEAQNGGAVFVQAGIFDASSGYACGNNAVRGGFLNLGAGQGLLSNWILFDNSAVAAGGAIEVTGGSLVLEQSDVIANTAPTGGGVVDDPGSEYSHVFFAANDAHAITSGASIDAAYSAWWSNSPDDLGGSLVPADRGPGAVTADPQVSYTDNGVCTDDTFERAPGSPLLDGGNPAEVDPDGTPRDIGSTGGTGLTDADGDGAPQVFDCDDSNPFVAPGLPEVCDGFDNDCDGLVDNGCTGGDTWFLDADGDGFGDPGVTQESPTQPVGYVSDGTDCDDTAASVNPGASEVCNGVDDDCSGVADDGLAVSDYFEDGDGDGYGTGAPVSDCAQPPGFASVDGDCDDTTAAVNPGATEVCNGVDDDCSGAVDDGAPDLLWYTDADADGFGVGAPIPSCDQPPGTANQAGDCDDTASAVNPDAVEVWYDGVDDDCDGNDSDQDGDGFDAAEVSGPDCDDRDAAINPDAVDDPGDAIDQNCDGTAAELAYGVNGKAPAGCGCSGAGGFPVGLAGWVLAVALVRRRAA
jgi:predicted outer membrane repeat protein